MLINYKSGISFNAISLNDDEKKKTDDLLHLIDNPLKKEDAKLQLFDIFDKHIQAEAKAKSAGLYWQEDFLQRLYLTFLESIENVKSMSVSKLLKILNDTKPNQEEIKEEYRFGVCSMDKELNGSDSRTLESILSEEKVPEPKSSISLEERDKKQKFIQEISGILSEKEQNLINSRAQGKTYKQIADEMGKKSCPLISFKIKSAMAKIQLNRNVLPEDYKLFADNFVKTFNLNLNAKEAINFIIDHIYLKSYNIKVLNNNIETTSKMLDIDRNSFIQAALKQPQLFCQKPETIFSNIDTTSKLLDIDRKSFIQAALKRPSLFYQKSETIFSNIDTTSKLLGINRKLYTQAVLKCPTLFCQKPETIFDNVNTTSKLLDIDKNLFTQAALKHPQLLYYKSETIFNNTDTASRLLGIDRKLYTQAALVRPSLFGQKPETIFNNIDKVSKLFDIDRKLYTQAALKQTQLFYQKPETIFNNIDKGSKLFDIDRKLYVQAALKQAQLFYQKPETKFNNIDKVSKLLDIDKKLYTQAALKQPSLFCQKLETIFNNIDKVSKLLDIDRKLYIQAALKQPSLFCRKPETIFNNINKLSKFFGIDRKILVQTQLNNPTLFSLRTEVIAKKVNIIKYYKQIKGKNCDKVVFQLASDKKLYYSILAYLVKKHDGLKKGLKENELIEYLKTHNKVYNFDIPKNELAEEFIKYAQGFSSSNFCKKMFNIVIR